MKDLFLQKEDDILAMADAILKKRVERIGHVREPQMAVDYIKYHLAGRENEVFSVMFLDSRHAIISCEDLFFGTIDGTEVHTRVVAKRALELNAASVICFHNHPSGNPEPSSADRAITAVLKQGLQIFDIRLLDHFVIAPASEPVSLASRGWV